MLANCWEINIPESLPRGFPPWIVLKFMGRLSLEPTLVFLPFTAMGIRDDRLLWTLLPKSFCRRAVLSALSFDEELLTLSLHKRFILTGILDFSCGEGRCFWSSFFSGRSHEAIASHPRFSFVLFLQFSFYSIWFFWFVLSVFFSNKTVNNPNFQSSEPRYWPHR